MWTRGHGYYNCKDHKKPLNLEEFFDYTKDERISDLDRMKRHDLYMEAWEKYHGSSKDSKGN